MKILKFLILNFSFFVLISCSNHRESLPKTKIVSTDTLILNNGSKINIIIEDSINGDIVEDTNNYLNVVTRSDTAQVVGLKVAHFATMMLGGLGGTTQTFTKEDLKGNYINSVPNKTIDYLKPELYTILKEINANNDNSITIRPFKFKLIYDGLTDNKYNFIYNTYISSKYFNFICSNDDLSLDDKTKPFNDWEFNNYELVQDATLKAIKTCMTRLKSSENMSKLEESLK